MKIAIVGGGVGGLATAAKLAAKHTVDVYEKEDMLGGRALSTGIDANYRKLLAKFEMANAFSFPDIEEIKGEYKIDLGFHLIGGGKRGACVKALNEIDADINFIGSRLGYIGEKIRYPMLSAFDKAKMLPRIIQLMTSSHEKIEAMKRMSMEEAIKKYGRGKLGFVLRIFPRLITTVNDLSKISAGETFFAQRELMGGHPVIYPAGGLESISKAFAKYIQENNGNIYLNHEVKNVDIEDGTVIGIDGKEYDAVVLNMPVQHIFRIAKEKHFDTAWVKKIKELKGTGSMVSYHAVNQIDNRLIGKSFVFLEKDDTFEGGELAGMIDFKMAHPAAGLAPPGKYIIQSYIICSPEEARNRGRWGRLREIIDKNLKKLLPDYEKNMEWSIYNVIWHLDGVAKTIDNEKPPVTTPVEGLYLAGDSVNSKGIGINCAVDSANIVTGEIEKLQRARGDSNPRPSG